MNYVLNDNDNNNNNNNNNSNNNNNNIMIIIITLITNQMFDVHLPILNRWNIIEVPHYLVIFSYKSKIGLHN